jgi:hypothetical protein
LQHIIPSTGLDYWKLRVETTVSTAINYWNLTNSHWEPRMYFLTSRIIPLKQLYPVIDPWTFTASVGLNAVVYASLDNGYVFRPLVSSLRTRFRPR